MIMSSVTSLKNLRVVPTVDVQRRPSDIGSRRACEKRNCRSDLFGLAPSAVPDDIAAEKSPLPAGFMSLTIGPGWTLLTVIPFGPKSRARPSVYAATAP